MSAPSKWFPGCDWRSLARQEISGATSSLHMYANPIPGKEGDMLDESDVWVKHASEHLAAASDILISAEHINCHLPPKQFDYCVCSACTYLRGPQP